MCLSVLWDVGRLGPTVWVGVEKNRWTVRVAASCVLKVTGRCVLEVVMYMRLCMGSVLVAPDACGVWIASTLAQPKVFRGCVLFGPRSGYGCGLRRCRFYKPGP